MDKFVIRLSAKSSNSDGGNHSIRDSNDSIITKSTSTTTNVEDASMSCLNSEDTNEEADLPSPSHMKKKTYKQKFRTNWMEQFDFIQQKHGMIFCKICNIKLAGGIYHIKRHEKSLYHIKQFNLLKKTPKISEQRFLQHNNQENLVKKAALKLTAFLAEHDLAFRLMDHLPKLCASAFPDSNIAKKLELKRKKATQITTEVLGPAGKAEVINYIKQNPFSFIIDETTDVSLCKSLAVIVRYFKNAEVIDSFLDLIEVTSASAESLYLSLKKILDENGIPYSNLVGLAADNASVMVGQIKSVQALLKQNVNSKIIVVGCTCHSFNLCSSYAVKKFPDWVENFVHEVSNYFSKSTKRVEELKEFQTFLEESPSKILRVCKTRWLSLQSVINRILKHWSSLTLFFQGEVLEQKVESCKNILDCFNAKITKCYLLFLSFSLEIVNKLNLEFQSEEPKIHLLLNRITTLYKTVLKCFIKKTVLDKFKNDVSAINICDPSNFLELEAMYFGANYECYIEECGNSITQNELLTFRRRALDFYIELCQQIRHRFDFKNEAFDFASYFDPKVVVSGNILSIAKSKNLFLNIEIDLEELNIEWQLAGEIGKQYETLPLTLFWYNIFSTKNSLDKPMFPNLMKVVTRVLALPHSSAAAERIFSRLNLIKSKTRNRLLIKTISAILHTKELLRNCHCYNFEPNNNICKFSNNYIEKVEVIEEDVEL